MEHQQDQGDDLGRKGFGARDADLRACLGDDCAITFAGNTTANHIDNPERSDTPRLAKLERGQGIGCLPRLADEQGQ